MALWSRKAQSDPIRERVEQLQGLVLIAELEQHLALIAPPVEEGVSVVPAARGLTQASPFVEADQASPERGIVGRVRHVIEARRTSTDVVLAPPAPLVKRQGFVNGIPPGGTTATNAGSTSTLGAVDRDTQMDELLGAYLTCSWVSTAIDNIARTITAGGLTIGPNEVDADDDAEPTPPPGVARIQALLDYCNPDDDIRQLMRRVITDMLIFGDAFVEVSWMYGEPVALWPLDCQTMHVISDEHGSVTGYVQTTDSGRSVTFETNQVIHVRMDAPGASLYGVGPTQKALIAIKTWLFAAGLIKETMKRGDPSRLHVDYPLPVPDPDVRKAAQQYASRNLGVRNIGNLFETRGGTAVKELSSNKIEYWLKVKDEARDEILSEYGVPKRKAGVSVPGSLGGAGAETGEDKTFRVNTCGPTGELALEKFSFALCYQAFGVKDWRIKFGEVDWRDDLVVEQIRDLRLRNGSWTANRYRKDIGEPSIEGGDDPVLVDRQNLVLWADMAALSKASVAAKGKGTTLDPNAQTADEKAQAAQALGMGKPAAPNNAPPGAEESDDPRAWAYAGGLAEYFESQYAKRMSMVKRELVDA